MAEIEGADPANDEPLALPAAATPCSCAKVRKAGRRLTRLYDAALQPLGLKLTQYSVLVNVARAEGQTVTVLAGLLAMDRTTLTRNLKPLERAGFVRLEAGVDARSRAVKTTSAGRRLLGRAMPFWQAAEERVRDSLGAADAAELHRLLDRIVGADTMLRDRA